MKQASLLTRLQFSYTLNLLQTLLRTRRYTARAVRSVAGLHHAR